MQSCSKLWNRHHHHLSVEQDQLGTTTAGKHWSHGTSLHHEAAVLCAPRTLCVYISKYMLTFSLTPGDYQGLDSELKSSGTAPYLTPLLLAAFDSALGSTHPHLLFLPT